MQGRTCSESTTGYSPPTSQARCPQAQGLASCSCSCRFPQKQSMQTVKVYWEAKEKKQVRSRQSTCRLAAGSSRTGLLEIVLEANPWSLELSSCLIYYRAELGHVLREHLVIPVAVCMWSSWNHTAFIMQFTDVRTWQDEMRSFSQLCPASIFP